MIHSPIGEEAVIARGRSVSPRGGSRLRAGPPGNEERGEPAGSVWGGARDRTGHHGGRALAGCEARSVRHPQAPRARWNGGGVSRVRRRARTARRDQGLASGGDGGALGGRDAGAAAARGAGDGEGVAPERRLGLRRRHVWQRRVHRDGVRARHDPARVAVPDEASAPRARGDVHPGGARSRGRARRGDPPPRLQVRQRARGRARAREGARLRPRTARGAHGGGVRKDRQDRAERDRGRPQGGAVHADHSRGLDPGDSCVHGARADPRGNGDGAQRPIRILCSALRGDLRRPAVRGGEPDDPREQHLLRTHPAGAQRSTVPARSAACDRSWARRNGEQALRIDERAPRGPRASARGSCSLAGKRRSRGDGGGYDGARGPAAGAAEGLPRRRAGARAGVERSARRGGAAGFQGHGQRAGRRGLRPHETDPRQVRGVLDRREHRRLRSHARARHAVLRGARPSDGVPRSALQRAEGHREPSRSCGRQDPRPIRRSRREADSGRTRAATSPSCARRSRRRRTRRSDARWTTRGRGSRTSRRC